MTVSEYQMPFLNVALKLICGFKCRPNLTIVSHLQLHTSELNDGYDWGRLNLQSVTEQSSMDDFLATAELAGTEFVAGK